jgi:hypothetical protein
MKSNSILTVLSVFGLLLAPLSGAGAGELPPPGTKPLSAILKLVEDQRIGSISVAEFDDGLWEVEVCDAEACQKLYLDPLTGEEKRRRKTDSDEIPPANSMPISTIIHSVEDRGLGAVTEVDFDDGVWEVELLKDGRKIKLAMDPMNGETMP